MFVPDYRNTVNAALNKKPDRIPMYEHSISTEIMEKISGKKFADLEKGNYSDKKEFFRHFSKFYPDMGYDTVSWEWCTGTAMPGSGSLGGHVKGVIQNRKDFDNYPWDTIPDIFFKQCGEHLRAFRETLPDGVKGAGGVGNGIFECVQDITGFENLCGIKAEDEELFTALFRKIGDLQTVIWTRFLREYGDLFCVCRFGDDLGFKTSTFLSPADIHEHIIPQYRRIIALIHAAGKPFLLHSCGCIFNVMDDIIDAGVDAKHSNEDVISPYSRWIDGYGGKIGNFGGIDTSVLCDITDADVVHCTENIYRLCEAKGHGAAIGSGNSIPNYVSAEKYCLMVDTIRRLRGD